MRIFALSLALAGAMPSYAQAECAGPSIHRSATLARDVGGVELGSSIQSLKTRHHVSFLGGEWFEFDDGGMHFVVGVTPLGRIYNIEGTQKLGRLTPNREFVSTLSTRLTAKYGPPTTNHLPDGPIEWRLVERVTNVDGSSNFRETNWAYLILSSSNGEVELTTKLVDFRVLWQDHEKYNCTLNDSVGSKIRF